MNDWIVRELEDLARYARENGMTALAEQLIEARDMAMLEIANRLGDGGGAVDTAGQEMAGCGGFGPGEGH